MSRNGEAEGDRLPGHDYRLVPVAAAAWIGGLAGTSSESHAPYLALTTCFVMVGVLFYTAPGRPAVLLGTLTAIVIVAGAAYGVASLAEQQFRADPLVKAVSAGGPVRVRLLVVSDPAQRETPWGSLNVVATAKVLDVQVGGKWIASGVSLQLRSISGADFDRGDTVVAFGVVDDSFGQRPPSVGVLRARTVSLEKHATGWVAGANGLKKSLAIATEGLPAHARGLIAGMAVGDDRLLEPDLKQAMLTASLVHLTAVSGSHVVIVMGVIALLVPGRGARRLVVTGAFLVLLVAVVGPEPSVVRAVWSAMLVGGGLLLKRSSQPQAALSVVVIGIVLISPWMATDYGFSMSVLATWGIIFTGRTWIRLARTWRQGVDESLRARLVGSILESVLVAASAQLWVFPISVLLNPWLPLWGVFANVIAAPAVAPLTVLGLAAALLAGVAPSLAHLLCLMAVPFSHWIQAVAFFTAGLPGARFPWCQGSLGVAVAAGLVGLVNVMTVAAQRVSKTEEASGGSSRLSIDNRSFRSRAGSGRHGQRDRDGPVGSRRFTGSPTGARAGPRHRAD